MVMRPNKFHKTRQPCPCESERRPRELWEMTEEALWSHRKLGMFYFDLVGRLYEFTEL